MWLSDLLSVLGDHAAIIALAVLVYNTSHSAVAVALASAAAYVPAFGIGPLLATYADRFAYRPVMITCDLIRAVAYAAILIPALPVAAIVSIVLLAHCATFPFSAARAAQLPQIAGGAYGDAQQVAQATVQVGGLVGYAMGGTLVAIGGVRGAIAVNVASFIVSAACVARVSARARSSQFGDGSPVSAKDRLLSGVRSVRRDALIFWPAVMVTAVALGSAGTEAMAVVVARQLHPQSSGGGWILSALLILPLLVSLISIAMCPSAGAPRRLVRLSAWMAIGSHCFAIVALVCARHGGHGVELSCAAYAALGVSTAMTVPCVTVVGQRLPPNNRASVFSLLESLLVAGQAGGALLAGLAVSQLGLLNGICLLLLPAIALCGLALSRLPAPAARHLATEHEAPTRVEPIAA